ncbi:hypothetical protein MRX96_026599 [Rhipicephalus microplus]
MHFDAFGVGTSIVLASFGVLLLCYRPLSGLKKILLTVVPRARGVRGAADVASDTTNVGRTPAAAEAIQYVGVAARLVGTGVAVSVFYLHLLDFGTSRTQKKPQHYRYPWPPTEASTNQLRRAGNDTPQVQHEYTSAAMTTTSVTSTQGNVNSQRTALIVADSGKVAYKRQDV